MRLLQETKPWRRPLSLFGKVAPPRIAEATRAVNQLTDTAAQHDCSFWYCYGCCMPDKESMC